MSGNDKTKGFKLPKWFIFLVLPGVLIIWFLFWFIPIKYFGFENGANAVTIAEALNGANSLFTGLAFAFLIVTIWQQRQELHAQREEMTKSIEELRGQKEQLIMQNEQAFFFKLLEVFQKSHDELSYYRESGGIPKTGEKALSTCIHAVDRCINKKIQKNSNEDDSSVIAYTCFNDEAIKIDGLYRYQKSRQNLLNFVRSSSDDNKELLLRTVIGVLSTYDYHVMFYDSIVGNYEQETALINDLNLFQDLDSRTIPFSIRFSLKAKGVKTSRW